MYPSKSVYPSSMCSACELSCVWQSPFCWYENLFVKRKSSLFPFVLFFRAEEKGWVGSFWLVDLEIDCG